MHGSAKSSRRFRLPFDPFFVGGIATVVVAGGFFLLRQPDAQRARAVRQVPAIVQRLETLQLGHRLGDGQRPVQVVELFDFECPACEASHRAAWPVVRKYVETGAAAYTAYDLPLPSHRAAVPAAIVATCAERLDAPRAWELRDRIYATRGEWANAYPAESVLLGIAAGAGLDTAAVRACVSREGSGLAARYAEAWKEASARGLTFIPVWTVNGRPVDWTRIEQAIQDALEASR